MTVLKLVYVRLPGDLLDVLETFVPHSFFENVTYTHKEASILLTEISESIKNLSLPTNKHLFVIPSSKDVNRIIQSLFLKLTSSTTFDSVNLNLLPFFFDSKLTTVHDCHLLVTLRDYGSDGFSLNFLALLRDERLESATNHCHLVLAPMLDGPEHHLVFAASFEVHVFPMLETL